MEHDEIREFAYAKRSDTGTDSHQKTREVDIYRPPADGTVGPSYSQNVEGKIEVVTVELARRAALSGQESHNSWINRSFGTLILG